VHAAPRHAQRKTSITRLRASALAAVTLAGVAAAFVFLQGGSAAPRPARDVIPVTQAWSGLADYQMTTTVHRDAAAMESRMIQRARRAALAAARMARLARQQAAAARRRQSQSPSPTPHPSSGGGDAANSPLGICIRKAEEGGSYVWGPGNGGGAYQFLLSTWEHYGGGAGEFGVAGAGYQNQIFDNAIAAGGASNWTNYDGC
jgi:hypothetical protein